MKIKCIWCGNLSEANHPNKKFCGSKCKDRYHNHTNPRGFFSHLAHKTPDYETNDPIQAHSEYMEEKA